jgi:hypothetical protein
VSNCAYLRTNTVYNTHVRKLGKTTRNLLVNVMRAVLHYYAIMLDTCFSTALECDLSVNFRLTISLSLSLPSISTKLHY